MWTVLWNTTRRHCDRAERVKLALQQQGLTADLSLNVKMVCVVCKMTRGDGNHRIDNNRIAFCPFSDSPEILHAIDLKRQLKRKASKKKYKDVAKKQK